MDFHHMAAVLAAVDEGRNSGAADFKGETGRAGGRPGFSPEEGHEDSGEITNVLVDQESVNPVGLEGCEKPAGGAFPAVDDVAAES